ncbi:MAG: CHASE2 domain-containing protein [Synechococcaceae cyanobacterium RL_1_2]|nr:CHASE2 domain-containing protein [Synechococcaceae cyanobacterium RL_1_2]
MRFKIFRYINLKEWQGLLLNAAAVSSLVVASSYLGLFQILDWALYDQFFLLRSSDKKELEHTIIVTIDDDDVIAYEHPFSDAVLAQLLSTIKAQNPQVIGLDIYRDIPVKEGFEELEAVFKSTPNLIGVETIVVSRVKPPKILAEQNQVGLAEVAQDHDGTVRRAIIALKDEKTGNDHLGLATKVAMKYLEPQAIYPEVAQSDKQADQDAESDGEQPIVWGKTTLIPFRSNDGPYVNEDDGGYQILINYVGHPDDFTTVTMADVMKQNIASDIFTDKIVYIGAIGESLNDDFRSPLDQEDENRGIPGVFIHANISAQIINGALHGRPMIKVVPDAMEWGWAFVWSIVGTSLSWRVLNINSLRKRGFPTVLMLVVGSFGSAIALVGINFIIFQFHWWLPFVTPLMGLLISNLRSQVIV